MVKFSDLHSVPLKHRKWKLVFNFQFSKLKSIFKYKQITRSNKSIKVKHFKYRSNILI